MKLPGLVIAIVAAAAMTIPEGALARHHGSWERLGTRSVKLFHDHDVIPVTAARGDFRRLRLEVRENGIFVNDMTVIYANGAADRIPIAMYIPRGGSTRNIDLRGHDRFIRRINLAYRAVRNHRGRAVVVVWGRH